MYLTDFETDDAEVTSVDFARCALFSCNSVCVLVCLAVVVLCGRALRKSKPDKGRPSSVTADNDSSDNLSEVDDEGDVPSTFQSNPFHGVVVWCGFRP